MGRLAAFLLLSVSTGCAGRSHGEAESPQDAASKDAPKAEAPPEPTAAPSETVVRDAARPFSGYRKVDEKNFDEESLLTFLASADAICIGERHDNALDHYAQLRVIEGFAERRALRGFELGVALEMVRTDDQPVLEAFADGRIDEEKFEQNSRWDTEWGFPLQYYLPQLEHTRDEGASLVAVGVSRDLTRAIAQSGIAGLSEDDAREVPEVDTHDPTHRALFESLMQGHPMEGNKLDHYYEAQVVWDEKMAESAGFWLQARSPGRKLIILAGTAHCHRTAIPARLERRTGLQVVSLLPVDKGSPEKVKSDPKTADEKMVAGYDYQIVFAK